MTPLQQVNDKQTDGTAVSEELLVYLMNMQAELADLAEGADTLKALPTVVGHMEALITLVEDSWPGLANLCFAVLTHLESQQADCVRFSGDYWQGLVEWVTDILAFLEQPEQGNMQRLLLPLPSETREGILELMLLASAGVDDSSDCAANLPLDLDAFADPFSEPAHNGQADAQIESYVLPQAQINTAMALDAQDPCILLMEEFGQVFQDLNQLLPVFFSAPLGSSQWQETTELYVTGVQGFISLNETLEIEGLYKVGQIVAANARAISALEPLQRQQHKQLMSRWPELVIDYLQDPHADQSSLDLINHLEDGGWPQPINGVMWRNLFTKLNKGIVFVQEQEIAQERRPVTAESADIDLSIGKNINPGVVEAFLIEAPGNSVAFTKHVMHVIAGERVPFNVEAAQRIVHTLKGSANLLELKGVANLAHHLEDIFQFLVDDSIAELPPGLKQTLQDAADTLEVMIDVVQGIDTLPDNALQVLQNVLDWVNRLERGDLTQKWPAEPDTKSERQSQSEPIAQIQVTAETATQQPESLAVEAFIRVPSAAVDDMFDLVGESSITTAQSREQLKELLRDSEAMHRHDDMLQRWRFELENIVDVRGWSGVEQQHHHGQGLDFDPLEMDQYDELYSSVHAYIEAVNDIRVMSQKFQRKLLFLEGVLRQQHRLNKELEHTVITTRMVPISNIESRLQRTVRQTCRVTHKQAQLSIAGADLQIANEALPKLADCLMHILRNAVDHGIESPQKREAIGKPTSGTIQLTFAREGNAIVVRCADDGGGLDYAHIKNIAVDKGIIQASQDFDHSALARLIMTHGFSTRNLATQVSGRGVGMDAVRHSLAELNGTIHVEDGDLAGTVFILRLPIRLVTRHCLVVRAGKDWFAIPSDMLLQILAPGSGLIVQRGETFNYQFRETSYPLTSLSAMLNQRLVTVDSTQAILLLHTEIGSQAISVDQVVNSSELVIKSTGRYLKKIHGVSGMAMLGDNRLVVVLDVLELLQLQIKTQPLEEESRFSVAEDAGPVNHRVLIVDDSLSARTSLSLLLESAGYAVLQANNGLEAVTVLENNPVDIALIDLEMPRMNGLEFTHHIRSGSHIPDIPIIMVTSRSQQKHRHQAEKMGVNVYITKPYAENDLLNSIAQLVEVSP